MNKILLTIIVLLFGIVIIVAVTSKDKKEDMRTDTLTQANPTAREEATPDSVRENGNAPVETSGYYVDYSETALSQATSKGKAVLFFHAAWCPTCKAANEAFLKNADQIPANVTILKTDYDTQTALKQKYAITYQHTFVQVNENGDELAKWNGGDIEELKNNIK